MHHRNMKFILLPIKSIHFIQLKLNIDSIYLSSWNHWSLDIVAIIYVQKKFNPIRQKKKQKISSPRVFGVGENHISLYPLHFGSSHRNDLINEYSSLFVAIFFIKDIFIWLRQTHVFPVYINIVSFGIEWGWFPQLLFIYCKDIRTGTGIKI